MKKLRPVKRKENDNSERCEERERIKGTSGSREASKGDAMTEGFSMAHAHVSTEWCWARGISLYLRIPALESYRCAEGLRTYFSNSPELDLFSRLINTEVKTNNSHCFTVVLTIL